MQRSPYSSRPHRKSAKRRYFIVPVLLIVVLAGWLVYNRDRAEAPDQDKQSGTTEQSEQTPSYAAPDLQPVVDTWVAKQSADYHIQIYDFQADKVIGEHAPDEALFAASLYKIYIAYLSYKDFQSGAQDPNEILRGSQTRLECVDAMIRSSDSPCGEAMMADIGQQTLNQRVREEIGTTDTIFNGIETSASDSIKVLKLIHTKKFLTDEHYDRLMDSMLNQDARYRRGLAAGAPEATWHTKVGWNLDINYHDIGFMTLPDGREFAVAILGSGSGSPAPIADFAKTIYAALTL